MEKKFEGLMLVSDLDGLC